MDNTEKYPYLAAFYLNAENIKFNWDFDEQQADPIHNKFTIEKMMDEIEKILWPDSWGVVNPMNMRIIFCGTQSQCREFKSHKDPNLFICYCPERSVGEKLYERSKGI